jgi:hypothetical protein
MKAVNSLKLTPHDSIDLDRLSYSSGDLVFDITLGTVRLMDGSTLGGAKLATQGWTTSTLSAYPTSTSLATTLSGYVTTSAQTTALSSYVTSSALTTTLSSYVTTSAQTTALSSYVTTSAQTTALSSYVTTSAQTTALSSYVTTSSLSTTLTGYVQTPLVVAATQFASQVANRILAGPSSGPAGGVTFRALVAADIPALNYASTGSVALKANIASPTFSGTVTAPTAIIGGVNIKPFSIAMSVAMS